MDRDAFATLFLFVALAGRRALVPVLVAFGIVLANITFSRYRRELAAAAVAERHSATGESLELEVGG